MKKTFKTLTAFLLLLSLITMIQPFQAPVDTNVEIGISVCGVDDNTVDSVTHN